MTRENKNAVFTSPDATPFQPEQRRIEKDDLIDDPIDLAPLPSSGLLYPVDHPFHGRESVEIKAITALEENILTNKAYAKKGTTLSELLRSCLADKRVSPSSLLIADRHALLVAARAAGYGHIYESEVVCSEEDCGVRTTRSFDLSTFPINRIDTTLVRPGENAFTFVLPISGRTVEFRLLTGLDEEEMHITAERQKKLIGVVNEQSVTSMLLRSVVSVNGVTDRTRIAAFVNAMRGADSVALRKQISKVSPGIIMSQTLECPACGHVEEVSMPMGISFFWPNAG